MPVIEIHLLRCKRVTAETWVSRPENDATTRIRTGDGPIPVKCSDINRHKFSKGSGTDIEVLGVGFGPFSLWCRLGTLGFLLLVYNLWVTDSYRILFYFIQKTSETHLPPELQADTRRALHSSGAERVAWAMKRAPMGFPLSRNRGWRWLKGLRALPLWGWCPEITQDIVTKCMWKSVRVFVICLLNYDATLSAVCMQNSSCTASSLRAVLYRFWQMHGLDMPGSWISTPRAGDPERGLRVAPFCAQLTWNYKIMVRYFNKSASWKHCSSILDLHF